MRRAHAWRGSFVLALGVAAAMLAFSFGYRYLWFDGRGGWAVPGDVWTMVRQAQYVANGAIGFVYEIEGQYALPLFPILLAPLALLGDRYGLTTNHPYYLAHPSMWPLVAPVGLAMAFFVFESVRSLAKAVGLAPVLSLQVAMALLVVIPADAFGHYEDLCALAALVASLAAGYLVRPDRSALLFSLSIGFKQWTVLVLPLWVSTNIRERRVRALLIAVAGPALLAAFLLAVDFPNASRAFFSAPTYPEARYGHPALFVDASAEYIVTWPYRLLCLGVAIGVAHRLRHTLAPRLHLAGYAVVFLGRAVTEPVLHVYYLAPALAFVILHERAARGGIARAVALGTAAVLWCRLKPAPLWWWSVELALLAPLFWPAVRDVWSRPEAAAAGTGDSLASVDDARDAPGVAPSGLA